MYGLKIHRFGFYIHLVTVALLMYYVNETFMGELDIDPVTKKINTMPEASPVQMYCLLITMLYPTFFDGNQFWKDKGGYLSDPWNYVDICHITMGYLNIYMQMKVGTQTFWSKVVFILVFLTSMIKLFFFLRIFRDYTYICLLYTSPSPRD